MEGDIPVVLFYIWDLISCKENGKAGWNLRKGGQDREVSGQNHIRKVKEES